MGEKFRPTKEQVFISAGAMTAAGLGAAIFALVLKRHRERGDDITIEGIDTGTAEELGVKSAEVSSEPIEADIAYVGLDDPDDRGTPAQEVHAIGDSQSFSKLKKRVINGSVIFSDKNQP